MSSSGQDEQQANRAAERFYLMGAEIKPESDLFRQRRRRRVFCMYIRGGGEGGGKGEEERVLGSHPGHVRLSRHILIPGRRLVSIPRQMWAGFES